MTLEGSFAKYLSRIQNIFYKYPVPQEKDDSRIYSLIGIQPMIEVVTNNNIYNDNNDNMIII